MSRSVKIVALVLTLAVVAAAVTGIAYWSTQHDPNAVDPGFYVDGKKVVDAPDDQLAMEPVMLSIGDWDVPYYMYRHAFLLYKTYYEMYYDPSMFENDPDGDSLYTLKQSVQSALQTQYTWLAVAKEMGLELSEEDNAEIMATLDEQKEYHGNNFESYLKDMCFASEEEYIAVTQQQTLAEKAQTTYREQVENRNRTRLEKAADAEFTENYISAKHILIMVDTSDEELAEGEEISEEKLEEAKEAALEKAQEIYEEIMQSDDVEATFDELMHEYSEDGGLESNPNGYTFTEGDMVEIFYETAMSLEEGEVSEPVFSDSSNYQGYHIILRIPLIEEDLETNRESVVATKINEMIAQKETATRDAMPIIYGTYYDTFKADDIH